MFRCTSRFDMRSWTRESPMRKWRLARSAADPPPPPADQARSAPILGVVLASDRLNVRSPRQTRFTVAASLQAVMRPRPLYSAVGSVLVATLLLTGCSKSGAGASISVFSVKVGECFQAPSKVEAELSKITRVPCAEPHIREAYALVDYEPPAGTTGDAYPGSDELDTYAKGICAQDYKSYVGVDYLDSSLFYTYLFPSARSWEQDDDRKIICFVTTTGQPLTGSVKGTKK